MHPVRVNGKKPFIQRVQDITALQKQTAEGIRFIAEQFLLDVSGQTQAEKVAEHQRSDGDQQMHRERAQTRFDEWIGYRLPPW